MRRFAFVFSSLLAIAACDEKEPSTGGNPDAPVTTPQPDSGSTSPPDSGSTSPPDSGSTSPPDGGTASNELSCTTASLFAGDPTFMGVPVNPPEGSDLLASPPFNFRNLVFLNGHVFSYDGMEIWQANLTDGKLHKIAGADGEDELLVTGACADARFANIHGLVAAPDGSLFVSDASANAVLKITDPLGQNCTVSHYAGTPNDVTDPIDPVNDPPNPGNDNGPGSSAKFSLPERITADAAGNLYLWDNLNDSIRKIANDANHTVSTILTPVGGSGGSMITPLVVGGTLYVWGQDSAEVPNPFLISLDLASGNHHEVFARNGAVPFGGDRNDSPTTGGVTSDGTNVLVTFAGRVFSITPAGAIHGIAGVANDNPDFPDGYDPKASHPAAEMDIPPAGSFFFTTGANVWLAMDAQKSIYISTAHSSGAYVEKLTCH